MPRLQRNPARLRTRRARVGGLVAGLIAATLAPSAPAQGTYTPPFTPAQTADRTVSTGQDQGLEYRFTANDHTVTAELQNADYYVLHNVFVQADASFDGDINVNSWNILLGVSGNGTTTPETEFLLTGQRPNFDLVVDMGLPKSYLTDQTLTTTTLPNGDTVYVADLDYGVSSPFTGSKTNIAAYFVIEGANAQNLKLLLADHPEVILTPYNGAGGGAGFYRHSTLVMPGDSVFTSNNGTPATVAGFEAAFRLEGRRYAPAPGGVSVRVLEFTGSTLSAEVTGAGDTGYTYAVELSKDWPSPGTWEKVGELEQTTPLTTMVLNLATNLPPRVHFRLKWPP